MDKKEGTDDPYLARLEQIVPGQKRPTRKEMLKFHYKDGRKWARWHRNPQFTESMPDIREKNFKSREEEFERYDEHIRQGDTNYIYSQEGRQYKEAHTLGYANQLMKAAQQKGDPYLALEAAKNYDLIGQGARGSVKNRLISVVGTYTSREQHPPNNLQEIRGFLEQHPTPKRKVLETHVVTTTAILGLAAGFILLATSITGNVIGRQHLQS